MSKLLYIQASPRKGRSKSITVADAFLDSYIQANPQDSIEKIELFEADLPDFALEAVTAKYKVMHGDNHSEQDKKIWDEVVSVINTFKSADKYLFAVPMWNFSIPYRLKQYIDILVQPGLTFKVNEEGNYQGLVENKSVFIVYSSGGEYKKGTPSEGFDLQKRYMELILGFIGLTDIRSIIVEPTLAAGPDVAAEKVKIAELAARKMAMEF